MSDLKNALDSIRKSYGSESIHSMDEDMSQKVNVVPSGILSLDRALGIGGFPRGRITEIYGEESLGKTTLALHGLQQAQSMGLTGVMIDAECAFDRDYAGKLGINTKECLISQPEFGEATLEITERLIRSGGVDFVIIDSVAALVPKKEVEGSMGENKMGLHAKLMSQAMRKLAYPIKNNNCVVIFINQMRDGMGTIPYKVTTGGNSLKFYSSVRIKLQRPKESSKLVFIEDKKGNPIGQYTDVIIEKNKIATPKKRTKLFFRYGEGVDKVMDTLNVGVETGVIDKNGSWYSYEDDIKLGQGAENSVQFLTDNPEVYEQIFEKIKGKL